MNRTDDADFTTPNVLRRKMSSPYYYDEENNAVAWADEEEQKNYYEKQIFDEYAEATLLPEDQWSVTNQKSIEDLKKNIDIYEVLQEAGIEYKEIGDNYLTFCCPFHDDRNPSCNYWHEIKAFRCWSCGAKGDIIDFYWRLSNDGNISN